MRRSRLPTSAKVSLACCSCALSGRASSVERPCHMTRLACAATSKVHCNHLGRWLLQVWRRL